MMKTWGMIFKIHYLKEKAATLQSSLLRSMRIFDLLTPSSSSSSVSRIRFGRVTYEICIGWRSGVRVNETSA